jgi:hypothetical protein
LEVAFNVFARNTVTEGEASCKSSNGEYSVQEKFCTYYYVVSEVCVKVGSENGAITIDET